MTQRDNETWIFESHVRDHVHSKTKKLITGPCEGGLLTFNEACAMGKQLRCSLKGHASTRYATGGTS